MQVVFNHPQHLLNKTIDFNQSHLMSGRFKQLTNASNYFIRPVAVAFRRCQAGSYFLKVGRRFFQQMQG